MRGERSVTRRARALRRASTDTEWRLWHFLRRNRLGFKFRRQFSIPPYFVDFACVEAKLVIEADGSGHAVSGDHDRRDAFLRSRGWRVLRFWNSDILNNRDGVLQNIMDALETSPTARRSDAALSRHASRHPNPSPVATGEGEPRSGWEGAGTTVSASPEPQDLSPSREH